MKLSLKLQDHRHQEGRKHDHQPPLLLRTKIPITIFNLPFLSHFSTTTAHPSDLSLSLSTNFPSFPSLKVSYAAAAAASTPPLTLTLKSGTGLFGSPNNSPLVISAHFSFNPANPSHPNPTFSLFFKPQLGSFSLRKATLSHPEPAVCGESANGNTECDPESFGFVPLEKPAIAKDLSPEKNGRDSILKGIQLAARTEIPVGKGTALNFRWFVNFADDQMPVLRINKIGLHRVDDGLKDDEKKRKAQNESNEGEIEAVKGMCYWMKRELDVLTRINREMKDEFEEMKAGHLRRIGDGYVGGDFKDGVRKKAVPSFGSHSGGLQQRRSTRNVGDEEKGGGKTEEKKKGNVATDVENELQRAIMAANAAAS